MLCIMGATVMTSIVVAQESVPFSHGTSQGFATSANGNRIAVCGWSAQDKAGKPVLAGGYAVWNAKTGKRISVGKMDASAYSVAMSPDGKYVAVGGDSGIVARGNDQYEGSVELRLFDAETGKRYPNLDGHLDGFPGTLAFSPKGDYLVSLASDNMIRIWSVPEGKPVAKYCFTSKVERFNKWKAWKDRIQEVAKTNVAFEEPIEQVRSFAISPDGKAIAVTTGTKEVFLLDFLTGKILERVPCKSIERTISVAYSQDGSRLAIGGGIDDGAIEIWDLRPTKYVRVLQRHRGAVICLAFSSDNKTIASGGNADGLRVWDIQSGLIKFQLHESKDDSDTSVRGVAYASRDVLLTLMADPKEPSVQFWDASTGTKIDRLKIK